MSFTSLQDIRLGMLLQPLPSRLASFTLYRSSMAAWFRCPVALTPDDLSG